MGRSGEKLVGGIVHYFGEVASTNDTAHEIALMGAPEGTCVVAHSQTAGRGRLGRKWFSAPGAGIYLSVVLKPEINAELAPQLALVAGVAVAGAIRKTCHCDAKIKWPNDVTIGGKKVAGILAEMNSEGRQLGHLTLGIGINLNAERADFPAELSHIATSLKIETGRHVSTQELLDAVLLELDHFYKLYKGGASADIFKLWCALSDTIGRIIRVDGPGGPIEGKAVGLGPNGFLLVRKKNGSAEEIRSGDLTFLG